MHFIDPLPIYSNPEVLIEKDFAKHGNVLLSLARFPPIIHDDILPICKNHRSTECQTCFSNNFLLEFLLSPSAILLFFNLRDRIFDSLESFVGILKACKIEEILCNHPFVSRRARRDATNPNAK